VAIPWIISLASDPVRNAAIRTGASTISTMTGTCSTNDICDGISRFEQDYRSHVVLRIVRKDLSTSDS